MDAPCRYTPSYYQTQVCLSADQVAEYQRQAASQEELILAFFRDYPASAFSPESIQELLLPKAPITSVRRAITNLTKAGELVQTGDCVAGWYGRPVGTWRLACKKVKQLGLFE